MSVHNRHTDFAQFKTDDRVTVMFREVPRTAAGDARRVTGRIELFYTDERALIAPNGPGENDALYIVDFSKKHDNSGVRRRSDDAELGAPVYVEPA